MGIVYFGTREVSLGTDEILLRCPSCETDQFCDIYVTGKYFHIYLIPVFPTGKQMTIWCRKCGLKREKLPFEKDRVPGFYELNRKFRYPAWTWTLVIIIVLAIVLSQLQQYF